MAGNGWSSRAIGATQRRLAGQRGIVLVNVMIVSTVVMLIVSTLITEFSVAENRAVDELLVETQLYWATIGHLTYARNTQICANTGDCQDDGEILVDAGRDLTDVLADLEAATVGNGFEWDYTADLPNFRFRTTATVQDFGTVDDGIIEMTIQPVLVVGDVQAPVVLSALNQNPVYVIEICFAYDIAAGDTGDDVTCGLGVDVGDDDLPIGDIAATAGDSVIRYLRRTRS